MLSLGNESGRCVKPTDWVKSEETDINIGFFFLLGGDNGVWKSSVMI